MKTQIGWEIIIHIYFAVGYVYFDIFNQNDAKSQMVTLMSPVMPKTSDRQDVCLTFWYTAFGSGSSTILTVTRQDAPADEDDKPGTAVSVMVLLFLVK